MNVFFVYDDGSLVTPSSGSILRGHHPGLRAQLAKDRGHDVEERKVTIDEWRDGVAPATSPRSSPAAPRR